MSGMTLCLCAVAVTAASIQSAAAEGTYACRWVDFNRNVSPVARPLDVLFFNAGGPAGSSDREWGFRLGTDPAAGNCGWWTVTPKGKSLLADGWAAMRTALPRNCWGKASGVRIRLTVAKAGKISLLAYSGGDVFTRVGTVGRREVELQAGVNNVDVLWRDLGVVDESQVTAFGIVHSLVDYSIGISRLDVLFSHEKNADEYEAYQAGLLEVMGEWLAARGIDIRPLKSDLSADDWERRGWQAAQLIAMGEQIEHWSRIAKHLGYADSSSENLRSRRLDIVRKLEHGDPVERQIAAFQRNVDAYVDGWIRDIPFAKRKWYLGDDNRFHEPDGTPYRMYGPHYFRMIIDPNRMPDSSFSPWDIRYMSALGFNGMRLYITLALLEPQKGKFDPAYLKMAKDVCHEAERYGIAMSVDLHWRFPDWFLRGKPGEELTDAQVGEHGNYLNSYHWPEALIDTWDRLARELSDVPNIAAWEVPANEPTIAAGPRGAEAYPSINRSWNSFLAREYGSLEKLNKVWSAAAAGSDRYSLQPGEDWATNSIRPLGFQNDPDPATAYSGNPRLWDHIRWHAWMQKDLTSRIMARIRKHWPGAVGMMQRTIGDIWDKSPIPLSYYVIDTIRGDHVLPGTHYGMGTTLDALKASSQTYASYDSETALLGRERAVRAHVELGLGFCPFMYSALGRGEGGPILADDEGRLAPAAAYLPKIADWVRSYWPERPEGGIRVAVVLNGRTEAVMKSRVGSLVTVLRKRGLILGVFNGPEIVEKPELLRGYSLVITSSSYMDLDLLRVLDDGYKGTVLLYGRLDLDAYARKPEEGLASELVRKGILLADSGVHRLSDTPTIVDLSGDWQFRHEGEVSEPGETPLADENAQEWLRITVPGYWSNSDVLPYLPVSGAIGDAWYKRQVTLPSGWKGSQIKLAIGAIDNYDWTFFNGHLIGHTDDSVANAYSAPRDYLVPDEYINWDGENTITIRVRNTVGDGRIWKGPVVLKNVRVVEVRLNGGAPTTQKQVSVVLDAATSWISPGSLRKGAENLAGATSEGSEAVGVARQGRWFWWFSDLPWSDSDPDNSVLDLVLKAL